MAFLYSDLTEVSPYLKARKKFYTPEAWTKMINALKTVIDYFFYFIYFCFINNNK